MAIRREQDSTSVSFVVAGSSEERVTGRSEGSLKRRPNLTVILSLPGVLPALSFSAVI